MSIQLLNHHSPFSKDDLEGGGILATPEDTGPLHKVYSYLFERGAPASWKLLGCCTLVGLTNAFSTLLTLAEVTNLGFSDIIICSNGLLLSTGFLISLTWRFYSSHYRWEKEQNGAGNELSTCTKLCAVGSFLTVLLSPAVACLPPLAIFWFRGPGAFSSYISGVPLILSWIWINSMATIPILYLSERRKIHERHGSSEGRPLLHGRIEDCDTYEKFDETDGPTFLPQRPSPVFYDIFGGPLNEEAKAASTFIPDASWDDAVGPSEALHELIRWAISAPEESLPPSVASEVLAMAAISIGVCPDGMGSWDLSTKYTYLMSQTCDRLAEIFQQADPSAVPEHAVNVFLLVDRLEQFGVDVAVLGADNDYIPDEELKGIVYCLKSRSASLSGC